MSFKDLEKWKQAHVLANMLYLHTKYLIPITLSLILYTFPSIPFADAAILTKPANNLGLVGYWNFNEGTSTYAGDFSANSNTGTLTNMANPPTAISGWGNGKFDGGLNFDGVDDYVSVPDQNYFSPSVNDVTVSFWAKIETNATPGDDNLCGATGDYLIAKGTTSQWEWGFENDGNDRFCMTLWQSGGSNHMSIGVLRTMNDGKWHHYVGVMDYLMQYTIYVDGISVGTTGAYTGTMDNGTQPVEIGRRGIGDNAQATIDDVRVFSRALTASQVSALYKSGGARSGASSADLQQGTTLANGIVGHWTFDGKDTTNTTATDVSGQNNTGTFTNFTRATNAKAGKLGQGMSFDGVNDVITTPSRNLTANYTIAMWYKNAATPGTALIDQPFVWNSSTGDQGISFSWDHIQASFSQAWAPFDDAYAALKYTTSLQANTWYHMVLTYDGTTARAYLNGIQEVSSLESAPTDPGTEAIYIGAGGGGTGSFDDGLIDDVRVYNRALSAGEVKQLYNLGSAKSQASSVTLQQGTTFANGIVGHWTFDGKDTTNATATDMSGQGNNGRFTNFTRATNAKAGKLGQGMSFDGVDDYVDFGNNTSIKPSNPVTLSAWVKITDTGVNPVVATDYAQNVYNGQWMSINAVGTISVNFGDGGNTDIDNRRTKSGVTALAQNTWYHIVGVVRGATDMDIYINGVDDGGTYSGTGGALSVGTGNAVIGSKDSSSANPSEFFNGSMDDVRIYNRALSASEVKQLYLMGR